MPNEQQPKQGSQVDKYGNEHKEQSKKGHDTHPAKPEPQKGMDQKKEEQRHQTGR